MKSIFHPNSIAIVGATQNLSKIGGKPIKHLLRLGYKGDIFPVNPKYEKIEDLSCYPSLESIPKESIDCIVIALPSKYVIDILEECKEKDPNLIVIYSSGFGEAGSEEGLERQRKVKEFSERTGIRILGPNCLGFANSELNLLLGFNPTMDMLNLLEGGIGFVSQSGALTGGILKRAEDKGIGYAYYFHPANQADINTSDILEFLIEDPKVDVIAMFLEGVKEPKRFKSLLDLALEKQTPIVTLKVGRSERGEEEVSSHTGTLAGSDKVYDALFKQKGVIRVDDQDELFETAGLFSRCSIPKGDKVGVVSASGGMNIMIADAFEEFGIKLAETTEETKHRLSEILPSYTIAKNPVDVTGQILNEPSMYKKCVKVLLQDENVDVMMCTLESPPKSELGERIINDITELRKTADKPMLCLWGEGYLEHPDFEIFHNNNNNNVPIFDNVRTCAKSLEGLIRFAETQRNYSNLNLTG